MTAAAPPIVWTVAGSDSGGGAGLQADLRAFDAFGVHGCSVVAAVTAQNSIGVERIDAISPDLLDAQLAALAVDMPPAAIKTGLLGSTENLLVLVAWIDRLREEAGADFPKEVTAFREAMAVHGRYGLPCPVCGSAVQRIVYAENEANYCARCQTEGKLLADRAFSRLLKESWPKTIEELEGR